MKNPVHLIIVEKFSYGFIISAVREGFAIRNAF